PLQGRQPGDHRRGRRPDPARLHRCRDRARLPEERQAEGARHLERAAHAGRARRTDLRRERPRGPRRQFLDGHPRARQDTGADRRAPAEGHRRGAAAAGRARALRGARHRAGRQYAGAVRRGDPRGFRAVGCSGEEGKREGRVDVGGALRKLLDADEFIVAPGVFEMLSAKIADGLGFKALYMTGYGISASHLGLPDAGLVTYRDMVERARTIAQGTKTPLIADADTGFGGLLNVRETVRGYEAAGVQAIQIEDQEMPKKCGHTPDRRVVSLADAVKRIEVAVESRRSKDFLIVARTDARTALGLDEAIKRASAFADAGADILFVEAPESEDEFRQV